MSESSCYMYLDIAVISEDIQSLLWQTSYVYVLDDTGVDMAIFFIWPKVKKDEKY